MDEKFSILRLLVRLTNHITSDHKKQLFFLLILMLLTSIVEVFALGSVIPFLRILAAPEVIYSHSVIQSLPLDFNVKTHEEMVFLIAALFCALAILSGLSRILLLFFINKISFSFGADLSVLIYKKMLYQPYSYHLRVNSSKAIDGVVNKANAMIHGVLLPTLTFISSLVMLVAIIAALLYVSFWVSFLTFFFFGFIYLAIAKKTRERKVANSQLIAKQSSEIIKSLQEGIGGIRDVIINGLQAMYCDIYRRADYPLRVAQAHNQFIGQCPRYAVESLGMVLIALLAVYLFSTFGAVGAVPILGILALGAQRLLPVMQQAYSAWSAIQGNYGSLKDVLVLLDAPLALDKVGQCLSIKFRNSITFKNISFKYFEEQNPVISDLNLVINKGDRVGIVGSTGGGKSTLIDILMGLLPPNSGCIMVDGEVINEKNISAWQQRIAHVPQDIFLLDGTVEDNIVFGVDGGDINASRVKECVRQVHLQDVIESLPGGYKAIVGERGSSLSGGQRQRIAIARALYKKADIFIFDEATSSLDNETEQAVISAIDDLGPDVTIFMVAHRLTALQNCNQIIHISDGRVARRGTYQQLINGSPGSEDEK